MGLDIDMATVSGVGVTLMVLILARLRHTAESIKRKRKKDRIKDVNIGAIFGLDVGGTLSKLVYFKKTKKKENCNAGISTSSSGFFDWRYDTAEHLCALDDIYTMLDVMVAQATKKYSQYNDSRLSFHSELLGGEIHFLCFETRNIESILDTLYHTEVTKNVLTIGCTGGGGHKYSSLFHEKLDIALEVKSDELKCLVRGLHFVLMNKGDECYTYRYNKEVETQQQREQRQGASWRRDNKEFSFKTQIKEPYVESSFPYLLVNIGSGVSIVKVSSPGQCERVSGTSIGGGTYWGLCKLLFRDSSSLSFEDVLDKAEAGDAALVDMLVGDIYGQAGSEGLNLPNNMVASSFGKLVMKQDPLSGIQEEDLAIALLMMITNNIGQVAHLNAVNHGCKRIFFVGNFLRHNPISCRRLAFAIDFWSKGSREALFLEHEGYFGAVGAFLESAFGPEVDDILVALQQEMSNKKKKRTAPVFQFSELFRFSPGGNRKRTQSTFDESSLLKRELACPPPCRRTRSQSLDTAGMDSPRRLFSVAEKTEDMSPTEEDEVPTYTLPDPPKHHHH